MPFEIKAAIVAAIFVVVTVASLLVQNYQAKVFKRLRDENGAATRK